MKKLSKLEKEKYIETIKDKAEKESKDIAVALYEKNKNSPLYDEELTNEEMMRYKIKYCNDELDFIVDNYTNNYNIKGLLKNVLYLLEEYKSTNQTKKCNSIYLILNKYFTVESVYDEDCSYPEWVGFEFVKFISCPRILKEMIKEKVTEIENAKNKKELDNYKNQADEADKEIIDSLEL